MVRKLSNFEQFSLSQESRQLLDINVESVQGPNVLTSSGIKEHQTTVGTFICRTFSSWLLPSTNFFSVFCCASFLLKHEMTKTATTRTKQQQENVETTLLGEHNTGIHFRMWTAHFKLRDLQIVFPLSKTGMSILSTQNIIESERNNSIALRSLKWDGK